MKNLRRPRLLPALGTFLKFGVIALTAGLLAPSVQATTHLKISANGAAIDAFENWTSVTPWAQIENYRNANAARPVIDLLLELQALKAGGLDFDFELVRTINYEQAKIEVVEGRAQLTAETIWDDEIAEHAAALRATDDIIRNGEFVKGIYVLPTNAALLKLSTIDELRAATGGVVSSWVLDVKTLEQLKPKAVEKRAAPELVFQAIQKGQIDFMLDEFSAAPDMSDQRAGVRLIPVPNYTVAIAGARAWNPVFDVTPAALIDVIVTERGIVEKPDAERMMALFGAPAAKP